MIFTGAIMLSACATSDNSELLLNRLDQMLVEKDIYTAKKQEHIDSMIVALHLSSDVNARAGLIKAVCLEYTSFQKDSALVYVEELNRIANLTGNVDMIVESRLLHARILSSMGLFDESQSILKTIDPDIISGVMKPEYLLTQATICDNHKYFAYNELDEHRYDQLGKQFRDSLLECDNIPTYMRDFTIAPVLLFQKRYDDAIQVVDSLYMSYPEYSRNAGIMAYSLAMAHLGKGDRNEAKRYFAISAIADVMSATRGNRSLRMLAKLIFEDGDIVRSSTYMRNAMEDALACSARLNTIETADMYILTDKALQAKQKRDFTMVVSLLSAVILLCILLVVLFVKLKKQKHKVEEYNVTLAEHLNEIKELNGKLASRIDEINELNRVLVDSSRIKEEYVGQYMEQYSSYLAQIDTLRKKALKIAKNEDPAKVIAFLQSSLNTEENLAEFYNNFDKTVLHLFPNFVNDFNALLLPEHAIVPGPGKRLTPELRIFALIRLGISDSVKIAHFLQYSLSTIYNYRSKMRNKAAGDRADFEERVSRISSLQ